MLKRDLINEVHGYLDDHYKHDITQAVDIILNDIIGALVEERRIEIRGFGSFSVRNRKSKNAKNPRTGVIMNIPERKTIHFTMSKSLKETLIRK